MIMVPISAGELVDKITILNIKYSKIKDPRKRHHIIHELSLLNTKLDGCFADDDLIDINKILDFKQELYDINLTLWDVEDKLRQHEAKKLFDDIFISLARHVYQLNDKRAKIKQEINKLCCSEIVEIKEHPTYD